MVCLHYNLSCNLTFTVSRWIWGSHKRESTQKGSVLALKPRVDVTKSPKQGYQWPHGKDLCPPNFFIKKLYLRAPVHFSTNPWSELNDSEFSLNFKFCQSTTMSTALIIYLTQRKGAYDCADGPVSVFRSISFRYTTIAEFSFVLNVR